jgi:hypothetical protein
MALIEWLKGALGSQQQTPVSAIDPLPIDLATGATAFAYRSLADEEAIIIPNGTSRRVYGLTVANSDPTDPLTLTIHHSMGADTPMLRVYLVAQETIHIPLYMLPIPNGFFAVVVGACQLSLLYDA